MKLVCKIACLALLMNTLPGIGQERVFYKTVQVDALNIFYREAGPANGPVILLLHGVPTSSRMYQALLESPLSAKYRLIAPDFPVSVVAAEFVTMGSADAQPGQTKSADTSRVKARANTSFASLKQIDAGVLNIGYAEAGAVDGAVVILLRGWLAVLFLNLASPCGCNGGFENERRFS